MKNNKKFDFYFFQFLNYLRLFKRYFYSLKDNYKKHNKYLKHKIGNINLHEVNRDLSFFKNINSSIVAQKIEKNLFLIKKSQNIISNE